MTEIKKRIEKTVGILKTPGEDPSNPFPQEPKDILHRLLEVADESANILCTPQLRRSAPYLYKHGMKLRQMEKEIYKEYQNDNMEVVHERLHSSEFKNLLHETAYIFDSLRLDEIVKKGLNDKLSIMTKGPASTYRTRNGSPQDPVGDVYEKFNKIMRQELRGATPQLFTAEHERQEYPQADKSIKLLHNLVASSYRSR